MFSSRMKRSLDFQLCKQAKGKEVYCEKCKCTWASYYETAEKCFQSDPEYKGRVKQEEAIWDEDSLQYCNRQAVKFSLDPGDKDYCGVAGIGSYTHILVVVGVLASVLWTL